MGDIYYHRFEIEETFKDTKHLFELHRLKFIRPTSLKVVLWLVFLGIALLYVVARPNRQHTSTNPKKFVFLGTPGLGAVPARTHQLQGTDGADAPSWPW